MADRLYHPSALLPASMEHLRARSEREFHARNGSASTAVARSLAAEPRDARPTQADLERDLAERRAVLDRPTRRQAAPAEHDWQLDLVFGADWRNAEPADELFQLAEGIAADDAAKAEAEYNDLVSWVK